MGPAHTRREEQVCEAVQAQCARLSVTPAWAVARQAPLSVGFPRQEYWRRLPLPSPGDFPDPGTELVSPASLLLAGGLFSSSPKIGSDRREEGPR